MAMEAIENSYLHEVSPQSPDNSLARIKVLERLAHNRKELLKTEQSEEAEDFFAFNSFVTMKMKEGWPIQDIDEVSAWIRKEIRGTFLHGKVMGI